MMMMAVARQRASHRSGGSTRATYTYIDISSVCCAARHIKRKGKEFLQPDGSSPFSLKSLLVCVFRSVLILHCSVAATPLSLCIISSSYLFYVKDVVSLYTSPRDRNDIVWYLPEYFLVSVQTSPRSDSAPSSSGTSCWRCLLDISGYPVNIVVAPPPS
jgi:hypothetical protein